MPICHDCGQPILPDEPVASRVDGGPAFQLVDVHDRCQYARPPFQPGEVETLEDYQRGERFHPYTCCAGEPMTVSRDGLYCPKCRRVQTWVFRWTTVKE